jgi:WD40 repeat protein/tetratricopeptide (TPR) repeat protein
MLSQRTPAELPEKNGQPKVALATVSRALEAWIARLVLRAPEERFSSAALARRALRDPAPVSTRSSRRSRAVRLSAIILASVAVVLAIALRDLWPKSPKALAGGPAALPVQTAGAASDLSHATGRIRWVRNFIGHWSAVFGVAVDPAGKNLVTTSNDGTAKLWDIDTGSPIRSFLGHKGRVGAAVFTRDGERIVTGSDTIRVFDVDTAALVKTLDGHTGEVASLAVSPDGARLASTAFDGTCRIWDLETGTELRQIAEPRRCFGVAWSGDGDKIAAGCEDGSVYVVNPATGQKTGELRAHASAIDAILFSPDGKTLVTSSDDHTIGVLNSVPLSVLRHLTGHEDEVWAIALATDGQTLVSGGKDGTLRLWNLYTGAQNDIYQTKLEPILKLVFLPDGKRFIAAHAGSAASLFTLREPSWLPPLVTAPMPRPPLEFTATDPEERKLTLTAQREIDDHPAGPFHLARELVTHAIAINPKYAPAHAELARVEYRSGYLHHDEYEPTSLKRALAEADQAVALDPTFAEAYVVRGYAQLFAKRMDDARESATKAAELAPKHDRVVLLSLSLAEAAKNYDLEFDIARGLIETSKDPHTLSQAYAALIKAYDEREEWDAVESTYSSLFNIDPGDAWAKGNYAQYLSWRGKHDEAIKWATKALATFDYPAGHAILADAYASKALSLLDTNGFMDDAERLIDLAQKASSTSAVAWYALGRLHRAKDNPLRARLAFETALHLKPDYPAAKAALAAL